MSAIISPLSSLVTLSVPEVAAYGIKTAGVVELMQLQPGSPVPYEVPDGWAATAADSRHIEVNEIARSFAEVTAKMGDKGVVLVRSSAMDESPGQNITRFVPFIRSRSEESLQHYVSVFREVANSKEAMGVLVMPLVGAMSVLTDGREVLGAKNISFVADSHSPVIPDESYMAFVQGLGTRVVDVGDDFIAITADRDNGYIRSVANRTEQFILTNMTTSSPVDAPERYKQKLVDVFNVGTGKLVTVPIDLTDPGFLADFKERSGWHMSNGRMFDINDRQNTTKASIKDNKYQSIGFLPMTRAAAVANMHSILCYLSKRKGMPVQIEGAFIDPSATVPSLYQMIDIPESIATAEPVDQYGADIVSNMVMGVCSFRGPFMFLIKRMEVDADFDHHPDVAQAIADLEATEKPYALAAVHQEPQLINRTKGSVIRISRAQNENMSCHAATFTRILQSRHPEMGYTVAFSTDIRNKKLLKALERYHNDKKNKAAKFILYPDALIRADGNTLIVQLEPEKKWPLRNFIRRWREKRRA